MYVFASKLPRRFFANFLIRSADGAEVDQNPISETMADLKSNSSMETSEAINADPLADPPVFLAQNVQEVIVGDNNPNKSFDVAEFVRDDDAILNSSIVACIETLDRELETDQFLHFEGQNVKEVIAGDNNPNKSFDIAEFVRDDAILNFSIEDDQDREIKVEPSDRELEIDPDFNIPSKPKRKYHKSGKYVGKRSTTKMTSIAATALIAGKINRPVKKTLGKIEFRDARNAAVSKIRSLVPGMSPKIEGAAAVEIAVKYIESIQIKLDAKKEVEFHRYTLGRMMEPTNSK